MSDATRTSGMDVLRARDRAELPNKQRQQKPPPTWPMVSRSPLISASGKEEGKPLIVIIAAIACAAVNCLSQLAGVVGVSTLGYSWLCMSTRSLPQVGRVPENGNRK